MKSINPYFILGLVLLCAGPLLEHFIGGIVGTGFSIAGGFAIGYALSGRS